MTGSGLIRVGAALGVITALSACEEFQNSGGANQLAAPDTVSQPAVATSETVEVERPDIFAASEEGLWDGRPSLGGVWVAHPDVRDPERVRITDPATGRTVTGALFRRERDNPGPRIQVSSDAAAAIGLLGGQPTFLEVIVLRTETIEIVPPPPPVEEPVDETLLEDLEEALESDEEALDTPSDEVEGEVAGDDTGDVSAAATNAAVAAVVAAGAVAPPPRRVSFWDRLTGRNRETAADASEATVLSEEPEFVPVAEDVTATPAPEVETAPIDAVAVAAAAIARAEADDEAAADSDVVETAAVEPASTDPNVLATPFIEIGLYRNESDADSAATALRQAGIPPLIEANVDGDVTLWRVLVGPIVSNEELGVLLSDVQDMGYPNATPAAN